MILLLFSSFVLSDSSAIIGGIQDITAYGQRALFHNPNEIVPNFPLTYVWETQDDLIKKRNNFLAFHVWYEKNPPAALIPFFTTSVPIPKHISMLNDLMHQFSYSNNPARKQSMWNYIRNELYLATTVYRTHLFELYYREINMAIRKKEPAALGWPKERISNWLARKQWIFKQMRADLFYNVYHCVCVPAAKTALAIGVAYCAAGYVCM